MLFKSALLTQASGSVGGITASRNRGGMYFRARAIPVDPNTPDQVIVRQAFTLATQRWTLTLTTPQRDAWDVFALNTPVIGPLGDPIILSGQQQFIRSNSFRLARAQGLLLAAPTIFNNSAIGPISADTATQAGQTVNVNFSNIEEWAVLANGFLNIHVARPQNVSINYFRGPYRFAQAVAGDPVPPTSPVAVTVPFSITVGQRLFLRARATTADGRLTRDAFLGPVLVAA